MKCQKAKRLLSRYLDQELCGPELEQVEKHLAECAWCREELLALRECGQVLISSALSVPEPPAFLIDKVMSELRAGTRGRAISFWQRALPLAAGVILVITGAWLGVFLGREYATENKGGSVHILTVSEGLSLEDIYQAIAEE